LNFVNILVKLFHLYFGRVHRQGEPMKCSFWPTCTCGTGAAKV